MAYYGHENRKPTKPNPSTINLKLILKNWMSTEYNTSCIIQAITSTFKTRGCTCYRDGFPMIFHASSKFCHQSLQVVCRQYNSSTYLFRDPSVASFGINTWTCEDISVCRELQHPKITCVAQLIMVFPCHPISPRSYVAIFCLEESQIISMTWGTLW